MRSPPFPPPKHMRPAGATVQPNRSANVGRDVTWRPRAHHAPHTGKIMAYVPAWTPMSAVLRHRGVVVTKIDADDRSGIDRYVVMVPRDGAQGQPLPPRLYAPHASIIDKALGEAQP